MIVQIAGTSGSGKSFLVRQFMEGGELTEDVEDGRILGYDLQRPDLRRPVYILGRYGDVDTAGCDTIKGVEKIYYMVRCAHEVGYHVLFEGLFAMNQTRGPALAQELGRQITIMLLEVPLGVCYKSVNQRRSRRGEDVRTVWGNTRGNYVRAQNYTARMREAGARAMVVSREEAVGEILRIMRQAETD